MRNISYKAQTALMLMLLTAAAAFGFEVDDTVPEVTDRVARISFLRGEVIVRRDGVEEWENAELNLPIVEGDEIVTKGGSLLEIQFSKDVHARLKENSILKIKELSDGGIAIGLTEGSLVMRPREFDAEKAFIEIDAPGSTIAVLKDGTYRIDAGPDDDRFVRVAVTDGGEARVYYLDSGFTLRSDRAARIALDGRLSGEWDTMAADTPRDDFGTWAGTRDEVIGQALATAQYGKYYDQDLYGAEELNNYGDWEYTADYGYIWQPHASAVSSYSGWSPYRYGTWRWLPAFGWTWVNDEPWGWATYHYGRWIWHRGRWAWTPYGYYRSNRSWWSPALVVIRVVNSNVCWYPIGYRDRYHNWLGDRRRGRDRDRGQRPGGWAGAPSPTPQPTPGPGTQPPFNMRGKIVPIDELPKGAVISMPKDDFGTGRKIGTPASDEMVKGVLARKAEPIGGDLPDFETVKPRLGKEILVATKPPIRSVAPRQIGASPRVAGKPLDEQLKNDRFYGNRPPVRRQPPIDTGSAAPEIPTTRGGGAVLRQERPVISTPPPIREQRPKVETKPVEQPRYTPPLREQRPKVETKPVERPSPPPLREQRPKVETKPVERPSPPPIREQRPKVETKPAEKPKASPPPSRDRKPIT